MYIDQYRDGGTVHISETNDEGKVINHLCIDNRIGTKTPGAVYPDYPSNCEMIKTKSELEAAKIFLDKAVPSYQCPAHLTMIADALVWIDRELIRIEELCQ